MKTAYRRLSISLLFLFLVPLPLQGKEAKFPVQDFSKVKPFLCNPEQVETLKSIGRTCTVKDFEWDPHDLNGDGINEWLVFGPMGECGAHGNCPLTILKKEGEKWAPLSKQKCESADCLGWANSFATEVLSAKHNGYRDLLIAADSGSFYWTKTVYEWDGGRYKPKSASTTYYLVDPEGKLKQVTHQQWENCMKNGKDCL